MNRYIKVEGDIIYPDNTIMTWGPFYYYSINKAKSKMDEILEWIILWVNEKDPSLNIQPENVKKSTNGQIVFNIKAWKDDIHLEDCKGIITVEDIFFEDENEFEHRIMFSAADRGIIDEIKLVLKNAAEIYMNDYTRELKFLNKIREL